MSRSGPVGLGLVLGSNAALPCQPRACLRAGAGERGVSSVLLLLGSSPGAGAVQLKASEAETMCSSVLSEGSLGRGRGKKAVRSIAGNLDSETFHLQFPQVLN